MNIIVTRDVKTPTMTLGKLVAGNLVLFTVEDAIREVKIPGVTAIPAGKYKVIISFSQRFQKFLPLLLDVPGFQGIRIHAGNVPEDSSGCILVGTARTKEGVSNSRYAMSLLMDNIKTAMKAGKNVWIEIS